MSRTGSRVWLAVLALVAAAPMAHPEEPLDLEGYRSELVAIARSLRAGETDDARRRARDLSGRPVRWSAGTLEPDPTVLSALVGEGAVPPSLAARVEALVAALAAEKGPSAVPGPTDRAELASLRMREELEDAASGGKVTVPRLAPPFWDRVVALGERLGNRVADLFESIMDWLARLWSAHPSPPSGGREMRPMVLVTVAIALALLGALAWRARRAPLPEEEMARRPEPGSAQDDDPLSRAAADWEAYARDLGRRGRAREAIRAWYHAALVTMFRAGMLVHRRGRTNWEYVAAIPPERTWRVGFVSLTRDFEHAWYGGAATPAVLEAYGRAAGVLLRELRAGGGT